MFKDDTNKKDLLKSLKTVEGQIRGIAKMIEEDRYCMDVLIQLAAVRAGVNQVGMKILEGHTRGCVTMAIKEGQGEKHINELIDILSRFVK